MPDLTFTKVDPSADQAQADTWSPPAGPTQPTPWLADEPGWNYGSVLPYRQNALTGELQWAVPEMLRAPVRGLQVDPTKFDINDPQQRNDLLAAEGVLAGGGSLGRGGVASGVAGAAKEATFAPKQLTGPKELLALPSPEGVRTGSVGSPAFQDWFGESKAVDESGAPLRLYHGTSADFSAFDPSKLGESTSAPSAGKGFFFSDKPQVANSYAESNYYPSEAEVLQDPTVKTVQDQLAKHRKQYQAVLAEYSKATKNAELAQAAYGKGQISNEELNTWIDKIEEPGRKLGEVSDALYSAQSALAEAKNAVYESRSGTTGTVMPVYLSLKNPLVKDFGGRHYREQSFNSLLKQAKKEGRDGAIFQNVYDGGDVPSNVHVVFDPKQIKSATGNVGSWDPRTADILHSSGVPVPGGQGNEQNQPQVTFTKVED